MPVRWSSQILAACSAVIPSLSRNAGLIYVLRPWASHVHAPKGMASTKSRKRSSLCRSAFFGPLALGDVDIDAKNAANFASVPNRGDDVVVCPGLAPYVRFYFPFHAFAGKGSPVVVEPQLTSVFVGGTVFGASADIIRGKLPADRVLEHIPPIRSDGKELKGETVNSGRQDCPVAISLGDQRTPMRRLSPYFRQFFDEFLLALVLIDHGSPALS